MILRRLILVAAVAGALALAEQARRERVGAGPPPPGGEAGLEEAWGRVVANPRDPRAWLRLGDWQAEQGQGASAEHSYRTAVRARSTDPAAFSRLAFLLYSRGKDQEALVLLRRAQELGSEDAMVEWTASLIDERLEEVRRPPPAPPRLAAPKAPTPAVPAAAAATTAKPADDDAPCSMDAIRDGGGRAWLLPIDVGGVPARLIIDTGASITLVTDRFAARAGLDVDPDLVMRAITANGPAEFAMASLPMVSIADRELEGAEVAVCEDCLEGHADGLLGLDLQAAFDMRLDLGAGKVMFGDCPPE